MKKNERGISLIALIVIIIFIVAILYAFRNSDSRDGTSSGSSIITTTKVKESRETYIPKCGTISYEALARNPNLYKGNNYTFTGKVIQVMDVYNNNIALRVNVTPKKYEYINEPYYEDTIYVTYQYSSNLDSRILEDDIITLYGSFEGIYDYISIMGAKISIPKIDAKYIDIKS